MRTALRRMGNSTGLIVPRGVLQEAGLSAGAKLDVQFEAGRIVASPVRQPPRAGWEEAARESGDAPLTGDEEAWLAFGNAEDNELSW